MILEIYPENILKEALLPVEKWKPYPVWEERKRWEKIPEIYKNYYIKKAEKNSGFEWIPVRATKFMEFAKIGNRVECQKIIFKRREVLSDFVIAECLEGKGRFLNQIIDGIWAICEESTWCIPAHLGRINNWRYKELPDIDETCIDIFGSETASLLSWTKYFLENKLNEISPFIVKRIEYEIKKRFLNPLLKRNDFWWMGFSGNKILSNWNPWINSNWLISALIIEKSNRKRLESILKCVRSVDNYLNQYPEDGGCDEGPFYWNLSPGKLFIFLEILRSATENKIDIFEHPKIKEMGKFIYRVHIYKNYFVNFADSPGIVRPSPIVIFGYGKRIKDTKMQELGSYLFGINSGKISGKLNENSLTSILLLFFNFPEIQKKYSPPLIHNFWFKNIQVMIAREKEKSWRGLFLAAKGGHNEERHNHNDVGSFLIYNDGKPVIVDPGVGEYTARTFSPERYSIWTMQSSYHNLLPSVDGIGQMAGRKFKAKKVKCEKGENSIKLVMDISSAYPPEANIKRWERKIEFVYHKGIEIKDTYELVKKPRKILLPLITPCRVDIKNPDKIIFKPRIMKSGRSSGSLILKVDGKFKIRKERIYLEDPRLKMVWGDYLTRVLFLIENPEISGTLMFNFYKPEK